MSVSIQPVNRWTRAGRNGRPLICPHCRDEAIVYHFCWCACQCSNPECAKMVNKYDYLVYVNTKTSRSRGRVSSSPSHPPHPATASPPPQSKESSSKESP